MPHEVRHSFSGFPVSSRPRSKKTCIVITVVVKYGEIKQKRRDGMNTNKQIGRKTKTQNTAQVRATISFPPKIYETLEMIAKEKKVSLAWVVREAAEKYVADRWPLFKGLV